MTPARRGRSGIAGLYPDAARTRSTTRTPPRARRTRSPPSGRAQPQAQQREAAEHEPHPGQRAPAARPSRRSRGRARPSPHATWNASPSEPRSSRATTITDRHEPQCRREHHQHRAERAGRSSRSPSPQPASSASASSATIHQSLVVGVVEARHRPSRAGTTPARRRRRPIATTPTTATGDLLAGCAAPPAPHPRAPAAARPRSRPART